MSENVAPITIPDTELQTLSSTYVDQEFKIFIALPRNYHGHHSSKVYPVLYVLDANGMFSMVTETIRMLQIYHEAPDLLIVGIGYPVSDFVETLGLRNRDLTPTAIDRLREPMAKISKALDIPVQYYDAGGAKSFLQFINKELQPFVHETYRADATDQILFGDSLGGLFALYTLFHRPTTFNRYIIGSPGIAWDDNVTFTYEANYAAQNTDLPAKVFMSAGALEQQDMITNLQTMARRLEERGYNNLDLWTYLFDNETHLSVIPATISRGIREVFK